MNSKFALLVFAGSVAGCLWSAPAPEAWAQAPRNLLDGAKWEYSTDRGETWSTRPPVVPGGQVAAIHARTGFRVADASKFATLELTHGLPPGQRMFFFLNGKRVPVPFRSMRYKTIHAIPPKLLKRGDNKLTARVGFDNRPPESREKLVMPAEKVALATDLAALEDKHLLIHSGPTLGAVGKDYFTVTCRTNMPARVTLTVGGDPKTGIESRRLSSGPGLRHRFRVDKLDPKAGGKCFYRLTAYHRRHTVSTDRHAAKLLPAGDALRFVAIGDSRTNRGDWRRVALTVLKADPDLVVFSGDMVGRGRNDWEWDEHYFSAARKFFARIPLYAVIGNHEEKAPLYPHLFHTPGKDGLAKNWSQMINGVLLIGIEGRDDWTADSENVKWLTRTLEGGAKARFIFFFSHYPAWSSANHGRLDERTGRPREREIREARAVLMPLLSKHNATAYICGHDHVYERSEPPGGPTHIISGGAGAPRGGKAATAAVQNPHSKLFTGRLHYCLIEVKGDTATMKATMLNGKVFDTRVWKARKVD